MWVWTELGQADWARARALPAQDRAVQEAKGTDCRLEASRSGGVVVGTREMVALNILLVNQPAHESDQSCAMVLRLQTASTWEREVGEGRQSGRRR